MAYEKHSWSCGENITADKMNNLENGIEEALDCCGGTDDIVRLHIRYDADKDGWFLDESYTGGDIFGLLDRGQTCVAFLHTPNTPEVKTSVLLRGGRGSYGVPNGVFIYFMNVDSSMNTFKIAQNDSLVTEISNT